MEFAERLEALVADSGKRIAEIANDLGIAKQTLYSYLCGKTTAEYGYIILLADYFGCSLDYLAGRVDEGESNYTKCPPFSERLKDLFEIFNTSESKMHKEIDISRSRLHGWVSGANKPALSSLIKLANYFGCTLDFLVGREN